MKYESTVRILLLFVTAFVLIACSDQEPDPTPEPPPPTEASSEEIETTEDDGAMEEGGAMEPADFEIWAVDQSDTRSDQGGVLYIWNGNAQAGAGHNRRRALLLSASDSHRQWQRIYCPQFGCMG